MSSLMLMVENVRAYRAAASTDVVREGRAWYAGMLAIMRAHAADAGITVAQAAGVYAACSINTPWSRNVALAAAAIADHAAGRVPLGSGGTLGMVVAKVRGILAGDDIDTTLTAGKGLQKLRNFTRNLSGDYAAVTCDRWAFRIATAFSGCAADGAPCRKNRKHGCGMVPKGDAYDRMALAYAIVAREYGEHPAQTQAVTWIVARGTGE